MNYFETLKAEQDSESRQNADEGTVDLLLKLKEKGKNSIGLNGGISGLSGTFIGPNYETNNFLGLGETLSLEANIGDLSRRLSFGFTQPYFRNKPISLGMQVFTQKYDYNPSKSYAISGKRPEPEPDERAAVAADELQHGDDRPDCHSEQAAAASVCAYGCSRVGASYSLSRSSVTTFNDNTRNVFQSLAFRSGVEGQNQLDGIITSVITPSFTFSSLDRAVGPHSGKDFNAASRLQARAAM